MKIFIDDERFPLHEEEGQWLIVRTPDEALDAIRKHAETITHLSFDNDLGFAVEGRHIMQEIFGTPESDPMGLPSLEEIRVHSANSVAGKAMLDLACNAREQGIINADVKIVMRSALHWRYETIDNRYYDEME